MIRTLIVFLPLFATLFSGLMHIKLASRTRAFWAYLWLSIAWAFFLFTDCCYSDPRVPKIVLIRATLAAQLSAPCVIPLLIMYLRRIRNIGRQQHPMELLWVVIPAILFTASGILYISAGEQNIVKFYDDLYANGPSIAPKYEGTILYLYYLSSVVLFRITLTIEFLWFAAYIIVLSLKEKFNPVHLWRYWFKGESIKLTEILSLPVLIAYFVVLVKLLLLRGPFIDLPWLMIGESLILTYCLLGIGYISLATARKSVTRSEINNLMRYNYSLNNKSEVVEEMLYELLDEAEEEALKRLQEKLSEDLHIDEFRSEVPFVERSSVAEKIFTSVSEEWNEDDMLSRFQHLMRDDMMFLQPRLSLDDVAEKMGTSKFNVSKLVNNTYNLGFPELVNILRVDYAEQYILNHKDAKQIDIAKECGFLSASSFNTIFKKVTGVTPKVWIAAKEHIDQ